MNIPAEIEPVLTDWQIQIREIIDLDRIDSVYIGGGIALGEFTPAWSDIDLCCLMVRPVQASESDDLAELHNRLEKTYLQDRESDWNSQSLMDAIYVPVEMVKDVGCHGTYFSVRTGSSMWVSRNISGFARMIMTDHPLCWYGEQTAFNPPRPSDLAKQTGMIIERLLSPPPDRLGKASWIVLKLCDAARTIAFWRDHTLLPKSAALRHEIEKGSQFSAAYQLALDCRDRDTRFARSHTADLQKHFEATRLGAAQVLQDLLARE